MPVTPTTTCVHAQMTYDNCLLLDKYLFNRRRRLFAGFGFIQCPFIKFLNCLNRL